MLLWQTHCYLRSIVQKSILHQRCFNTVLPTQTITPDRLYKKVEIEVKGNDPAVLKSYGLFATTAATNLGIIVGKNMTPKNPNFQRWTVLKSAHVHKKHRVQYEMRTYFRHLDFIQLTQSTIETFLEYIQRNLPEGVAMKVTKVEIQELTGTVQPQ